jgi:hypothetical protein
MTDGGRGKLPPDCVDRVRDDWRIARAAHGDLRLMGMPKMNLLLVGESGPVQGVLELMEQTAAQPIVAWRPGDPLSLPPVARARTVILHDVSALDPAQQQGLSDWLDAADGRAQVISTSPSPLLPRVEMGEFLDTLYYRLNMVYIDLSE